MVCPLCGELNDGLGPCPVCGHVETTDARPAVIAASPYAPPPPPPPPSAPPPPPPPPPGPFLAVPRYTPQYPPPYPGIPVRTRRSRRQTFGIAVGAVLTVALAVFGIFSWLNVAERATVEAPANWDPRIAPLAAEASKIRELPFKHPVRTVFHTERAFIELITNHDDDPRSEAEITRQDDRFTASLRAIGLGEGDFSAREEADTVATDGVVAFYSPSEETIHIRGTTLSLQTEVILVHELTHVLQDQHFDLEAISNRAREHKTDAPRTLIEGDADWVEQRYVESLSAAEQSEYERLQASYAPPERENPPPDILTIDQYAPYSFGPSLVGMLIASDGLDAVNDALRDPPMSDFLVMNPWWYVDERAAQRPTALQRPEHVTHYERAGEFGAWWWYSMLAERIDAHEALRVLDGWVGDSAEIYSRKGNICARLVWRGNDRKNTLEMRTAVARWRNAMPKPELIDISNIGLYELQEEEFSVETCDPGTRSRVVTHDSRDAFSLPVQRAGLAAALASEGIDIDIARCAADAVLRRYSTDALNNGNDADTAALRREIREAVATCSSPDRLAEL